jgi:hypothetical protein
VEIRLRTTWAVAEYWMYLKTRSSHLSSSQHTFLINLWDAHLCSGNLVRSVFKKTRAYKDSKGLARLSEAGPASHIVEKAFTERWKWNVTTDDSETTRPGPQRNLLSNSAYSDREPVHRNCLGEYANSTRLESTSRLSYPAPQCRREGDTNFRATNELVRLQRRLGPFHEPMYLLHRIGTVWVDKRTPTHLLRNHVHSVCASVHRNLLQNTQSGLSGTPMYIN